jgi:hypothetical protein
MENRDQCSVADFNATGCRCSRAKTQVGRVAGERRSELASRDELFPRYSDHEGRINSRAPCDAMNLSGNPPGLPQANREALDLSPSPFPRLMIGARDNW